MRTGPWASTRGCCQAEAACAPPSGSPCIPWPPRGAPCRSRRPPTAPWQSSDLETSTQGAWTLTMPRWAVPSRCPAPRGGPRAVAMQRGEEQEAPQAMRCQTSVVVPAAGITGMRGSASRPRRAWHRPGASIRRHIPRGRPSPAAAAAVAVSLTAACSRRSRPRQTAACLLCVHNPCCFTRHAFPCRPPLWGKCSVKCSCSCPR